jgi:hypothetical protein
VIENLAYQIVQQGVKANVSRTLNAMHRSTWHQPKLRQGLVVSAYVAAVLYRQLKGTIGDDKPRPRHCL